MQARWSVCAAGGAGSRSGARKAGRASRAHGAGCTGLAPGPHQRQPAARCVPPANCAPGPSICWGNNNQTLHTCHYAAANSRLPPHLPLFSTLHVIRCTWAHKSVLNNVTNICALTHQVTSYSPQRRPGSLCGTAGLGCSATVPSCRSAAGLQPTQPCCILSAKGDQHHTHVCTPLHVQVFFCMLQNATLARIHVDAQGRRSMRMSTLGLVSGTAQGDRSYS
jgi:hypothetical protein